MCRLLGYVSDDEVTISDMAGESFAQFAALSAKHGDGWGIASFDSENAPALLLEPSRASESEQFRVATSTLKVDAALLHLRWATLGLGVNEGNTHPFKYGEYLFMHNGGIMPPSSLDQFIDSDLLENARGDTDSEKYFLSLVTQIRKSNVIDGIKSGLRQIIDNCTYSSINAMFLTPDYLIAIAEHNIDRIPADEGSNYYELFYRKGENGVLVASTGWDQDGWTNLPNHHLMIVNKATLDIEIQTL